MPGEDASETEFGDLVFQKQFYSTANRILKNGKELRLKRFARSWLEVTETGDDHIEYTKITFIETDYNFRVKVHRSRGKKAKKSPKKEFKK